MLCDFAIWSAFAMLFHSLSNAIYVMFFVFFLYSFFSAAVAREINLQHEDLENKAQEKKDENGGCCQLL